MKTTVNKRAFNELLYKFCRILFAGIIIMILWLGLTNCKKNDAGPEETAKGKLMVKGVRTTYCGPQYPQKPVEGAMVMIYNKPCVYTIQNAYKVLSTNSDGNTRVISIPTNATYTILIENKGISPCSSHKYYVREIKVKDTDTTICNL